MWCTETLFRHTQGKPAPHGERRDTLDTMLKIEIAAGLTLQLEQVSLKPGKSMLKKYMHNSWGPFIYRNGP